MLHRINLPNCRHALEWIVQLQDDLITALCADDVRAADVTPEWIIAKRPDIDSAWINRFCTWKKEKATFLEYMQRIAALPPAAKGQIIQHFHNNLKYHEAFDSTKNPPQTVSINNVLNQDAAMKYCAFLELFYDPTFYNPKGFPIDANGNAGGKFHKDVYLECFRNINDEVRVCPLCDGGLDGSEVDHWLAKKHFPELSCEPHNLVEICSACNSRANKGEKQALSSGATKPFDNWFHPYLRPASGAFSIQIEAKGIIKLNGQTAQDDLCINKLDTLINLCKRWGEEYRSVQIKRIENKIRGRRRTGAVFTEQSLKSLIENWIVDAKSEIGLEPHAMLEESVLSVASDTNSALFKEFLHYAIS